MKTLSILLASLMLITTHAAGQNAADARVKALIPPGWVPISAAVGDLNGDMNTDMVIMIRKVEALSARISIMVVYQCWEENLNLFCNSDIAAEDQRGTGPMYDAKSVTINSDHELVIKYTYYEGMSQIEDEMSYAFFDGDLRMFKARQNGKIENYAYELQNDINSGMVSITRWADVTNQSASPTNTTFERQLPEPPPLCTYDIGMFSRVMHVLARPVEEPSQPEPQHGPANPAPVEVNLGPESSINAIPVDGLYAYLDFGGDVADRSPAHRKTVQVGGEFGAFSSAEGGGALMLDGKSYVQIPSAGQKFKAPFSVSGWFNARGKEQSQTVVSMGRTNEGTGFNFGYNVPDKKNAVYFGIIGTIPVGVQYEMRTQGWHFACATLDDKEIKLYVDGALVQTAAVPRVEWWAFKANMGVSTEPVEIGRELPTLGRYFTGMIDNVALYSRVLTEDEVKKIWDATRPGG